MIRTLRGLKTRFLVVNSLRPRLRPGSVRAAFAFVSVLAGMTFILGSVSLVGCQSPDGNDDNPPILPPGGGGGGGDSCDEDSDCRFADGLEICEEGSCVYGDRNNSAEEAQLIEYGQTVELHIAPADDVDWFRFEGGQGEMVWFDLWADNDDSLDTVISYFNQDGQEIAVNDDFERVNSVAPNSRLFSGVPEDGTFYVSVQDRSSWANDPTSVPKTVADLGYSLFLEDMGSDESGPFVASEPNDESSTANPWPVTNFGTNYNLGGFLESASDQDWLSIEVQEKDILRLYGFPGHGGAGTTKVTVYLPDGTTPIRSYEGLDWEDSIAWIPVLETGVYYLLVEDSEGGGSFDHWYVLHAAKTDPEPVDSDGNPKAPRGFLAEVEPNDSLGGDPLGIGQGGADDPGSATRWGRIGAPGDRDCFSVELAADGFLWASFAATGHGEETNPKLSLFPPDQLAASEPVPSHTAIWDHAEEQLFKLEPVSAGTWSLCVEDVDPSAGGGNRYYQLRVVVQLDQ